MKVSQTAVALPLLHSSAHFNLCEPWANVWRTSRSVQQLGKGYVVKQLELLLSAGRQARLDRISTSSSWLAGFNMHPQCRAARSRSVHSACSRCPPWMPAPTDAPKDGPYLGKQPGYSRQIKRRHVERTECFSELHGYYYVQLIVIFG